MSPNELPIDLFQGWPSSDLLPTQLIQEATLKLLADPDLASAALNYGPDPGSDSLREQMALFLSTFYSSSWTCVPRLTITGGASSALATILQVYSDPSYTKAVYMAAPTYFLACRIFEDHGFAGKLRAVPEDDEGIDLGHLERHLEQDELQNGWLDAEFTKQPLPSQKHYKSIIYCVPTFSNPSGKVMSQHHREQLVLLARKHDALVITDDVYDFLHWTADYEGRSIIPRLVDIDQTFNGGPITDFGNVVSNGSFSKILGPGLRTGWTESTPAFATGLAQCGLVRSGGSPSQFTACVIAESLRAQSLQEHLFHKLVRSLRDRYEATLAAVETYVAPYGVYCDGLKHSDNRNQRKRSFPAVQGGYYIYLHLPSNISAAYIAKKAAIEFNLILGSGDNFEVHGDENSAPSKNTIRVCVAWEPADRLVEGISRLGSVLKRVMEK